MVRSSKEKESVEQIERVLLAQKVIKIDRTQFVWIMIINIVQWMWFYRWLWWRLQQNMKYFLNLIFPWLRIIITCIDYISLLVFRRRFLFENKEPDDMVLFRFLCFHNECGIWKPNVQKISSQWNFNFSRQVIIVLLRRDHKL